MVEKRRFERIYDAIENMTYTKCEDIPENKETFNYGFKHIKTDKIDNYLIIGCEPDELSEKGKLINVWSNKFKNEEIQKKFRKTGWPFLTLVRRNNFFKVKV